MGAIFNALQRQNNLKNIGDVIGEHVRKRQDAETLTQIADLYGQAFDYVNNIGQNPQPNQQTNQNIPNVTQSGGGGVPNYVLANVQNQNQQGSAFTGSNILQQLLQQGQPQNSQNNISTMPTMSYKDKQREAFRKLNEVGADITNLIGKNDRMSGAGNSYYNMLNQHVARLYPNAQSFNLNKGERRFSQDPETGAVSQIAEGYIEPEFIESFLGADESKLGDSTLLQNKFGLINSLTGKQVIGEDGKPIVTKKTHIQDQPMRQGSTTVNVGNPTNNSPGTYGTGESAIMNLENLEKAYQGKFPIQMTIDGKDVYLQDKEALRSYITKYADESIEKLGNVSDELGQVNLLDKIRAAIDKARRKYKNNWWDDRWDFHNEAYNDFIENPIDDNGKPIKLTPSQKARLAQFLKIKLFGD